MKMDLFLPINYKRIVVACLSRACLGKRSCFIKESKSTLKDYAMVFRTEKPRLDHLGATCIVGKVLVVGGVVGPCDGIPDVIALQHL
jgi:hypothetical protein